MAGSARRLLRSFAGGEIAPEMFGRIDLDKMQTGLAKAENFIILAHGPATARPGFAFVNRVVDSAKRVRVIPFAYSAEQTMVLEVGDGYMRFHTQGATLLEAAQNITAVSAASSGVITYVGADPSNGDVMFLTGFDEADDLHMLQGRFVVVSAVNAGANTFVPLSLDGGGIDTTGSAYTSGATMARVYKISTPWAEDDLLPGLHYTQSADVLTVVNPAYAPREVQRLGATNWQVSSITFAPTIAAPGAPTVAAGGPGGGTPATHTYVTTAVSGDTFEESVASASDSDSSDLTVTGNYVDVTPAAVSGAVRYNIYKEGKGGLFGYIGQSDGTAFRDDNIEPDLSQTPPEANNPFSGAGDWPSTVTYFEQRRAFAATDNRPSHVWLTRSATESNMTQSVPVRDDDAIVVKPKAMKQNRVRHLAPLSDLIALTVGSEFRIFAAGGAALTPSTATPKTSSFVGANDVQPIVAENAIIYAQYLGGHVREFAYAGEQINGSSFTNNDISVLAPHLFDGYEVVDLAYSSTSTCPIVWAVRNDGVLLGLTYVPGQNVRAWHRHVTDGLFESVCCVAENGEDVLYAVVQRTLPGGATVRNIERLHTRQFTEQADAFHVDSGLTYDGTATTTIRGLWHLEGCDVAVLADGAVVDDLTVENGSITLPEPASVVHVGLPYVGELQTLPLSYQTDEAFGQGVMKNVNEVHLRVSRSGAMKIGPTSTGRMVEAKRRTTEPLGTPAALKTGWDHTGVLPDWDDDAGVTVRNENPLPLTVLAMVLDVTAGG